MDLFHWRAVQLAIVALAESPVTKHWDAGALERECRGLDGTAKIRGEHCSDSVVAATIPELVREYLPSL